VGNAVGLVGKAPPGRYYIDGSGDKSDPRLRRCGWGIATIDQDMNMDSGWFGGLGDEPHTVPRSELTAFLWLLKLTSGAIDAVSDCKFVVDGFTNGLHKAPKGDNMDLWELIGNELMDAGRTITITWVKSHPDEEDILHYDIQPHQIYGNAYADAMAKRGAELVEVPVTHCIMVEANDAIAWLVQRRIYTANMLAQSAMDPKIRKATDREQIDREPRYAVRDRLIESSGHSLSRRGSRWTCRVCKLSTLNAGLIPWLNNGHCRGGIQGQLPQGPVPVLHLDPSATPIQVGNKFIHESHRIGAYRGMYWCWSCGMLGSGNLKLLAQLCEGPHRKSGRQNLNRIRRGDTPRPDWLDWPEPLAPFETLPADPFA